MEEQTKELGEYLVVLKKRKVILLSIFSTIFIISVILAFALPATYKSSSTILIEQQGIPQEMVQTTVTSYASERIQTIQARVMSRTNVIKVIDKFDLYQTERKRETTEEIVGRMREDTKMNVISADVVDPRTGRPSVATIAFELSYTGKSPTVVQQVASELTSLYLNENLKSRTQKAEETSTFLDEEAKRLGAQINELEEALAIFKQNNVDTLPSLKSLNMQSLERAEAELISLDTKMQNYDNQEFYLKGQLTYVKPDDLAGAGVDIKMMESEYTSMKARYSDNHPDVIRMKSAIEALKKGDTETGGTDNLESMLSAAKLELASLEERYTSDHPDVIRAREGVEALQLQLESSSAAIASPGSNEIGAKNPEYINIISQIKVIENDRKLIEEQRVDIKNKIIDLENKLKLMPQVEADYLKITRDYENAVRQYQETKAKKMTADVAKQMEEERKGERFTLIDPPAIPEQPISPNRPAILIIGLVLSIGLSVGFVFVSELIAGAVSGSRRIEAILGVAPLSVIPYAFSDEEIALRSSLRKKIFILMCVVIIISVLVVHMFVTPLDVLWFRGLRKADSFVN